MHVPQPSEFASDFLSDEELKELGERVIREKLPNLDDGELLIDYAWKRKGGRSGGRSVLGKCVKLSGAARYYALGAHFLIWLGADNCAPLNARQIEALMFHELKHIERIEELDEEGDVIGQTYKLRGHDVEMFYDELEQYGPWKGDLQRVVEVVRQLALPGMETREPVGATV